MNVSTMSNLALAGVFLLVALAAWILTLLFLWRWEYELWTARLRVPLSSTTAHAR